MNKPTYHFLVCNSFRLSGEPQGVCHRKGALDLLHALEEGCMDRNLDALVSSTGCLKACTQGPVVVLYPQGKWFGEVDEAKVEAILDAIEEDADTSSLEL